MTVREYIGARYVPLFIGQWDSTVSYEPLSVVTHEGNSYTSRQHVPVGVNIDNETFWAETGNYNSQVEQYREEVSRYHDEVIGLANDIDDLETEIADNLNMTVIKNHAMLIGHAGFSGVAPTNSSVSVQKAYEYGLDAVEIDVRKTADNVLVCIHNDDISYPLNGSGLVSELTLAEIRQYTYSAGSYVSDYPNLKIMTLKECISLCRLFGLMLYLDIKDRGIIGDVDGLIKSYNAENMTVYLINYPEEVATLENRNVPFFCLFGPTITTQDIDDAHAIGASGVDCCSVAYDATIMAKLQSYGMHGLAWDWNPEYPIDWSEYKRCLDLGVSGFTISNCENLTPHNEYPETYSKFAFTYSNEIPIVTPYGAKVADFINHMDLSDGKLKHNKISTSYPNEAEFHLDKISYYTTILIDEDFDYGNMILVGKIKDINGDYISWQYQTPANFSRDNAISHPINSTNYNYTLQNAGIDWYIAVTHNICDEYVMERTIEFLKKHFIVNNDKVAIGTAYSSNLFDTDHYHISPQGGNRAICLDYIEVKPGEQYQVPYITGSTVRVAFRTYEEDGTMQSDPGWTAQGGTFTIPTDAKYLQLYASRDNEANFNVPNFLALAKIWENIKLGR